MAEIGFIKGVGIWYKTELSTIRKNENSFLQPIFEAFTNSLESIAIFNEQNQSSEKGSITLKMYLTEDLFSANDKKCDFQKIEIIDTGIGFTDSEFERFINLRDDRKNFANKGTGRVQFLHAFDFTKIVSIFVDSNSQTGYKQRKLTLSKSDGFLKMNSIIRFDDEQEVSADSPLTILSFETVLNSKDKEYYESITAEEIKDQLIRHYLARFCENRNNLPQIKIITLINNEIEVELEIVSEDIPIPDQEIPIEIYYSRLNGSNIERTTNQELFNLKSFIIPHDELNKNAIKLVSKGEIAREIKLENLLPNDQINGNRYLFLLTGNYIDNKDSDLRGDINLVKKKDFKRINSDSLFSVEEILLEDIEDKANQTILQHYDEIRKKNLEKEKSIEELQKMFLLNPQTLSSLRTKINIGDTDDTILKKVYEADARIVAEKDAELKKQIENIEKLDTTSNDYQEKLSEGVAEFVLAIPLQNRTALTQYVARRKMVLELFDKILKKEIEKLTNGGRIDEDLMHNLIFQQSSSNPEVSDLWLIAEEFIYFNGFSESRLNQIEIQGIKLFKDSFTEEENRYLNSLGERRLTKRPDILLFPDEGKCILIEFKAPDVNVSDHLYQIDFYANLIRNYSNDEFQITTFYGYLIGESIEDRDVRGRVTRFEHSYHLDYWFRPSETVTGFDNRSNGSIYTEVIKYTTLLKRAQQRNKIFIDKLTC